MFTVLDVSRWQGRIDWDTVKASGRGHGVMLRALGLIAVETVARLLLTGYTIMDYLIEN